MTRRTNFDLNDKKLKELKAHFYLNKKLLDIPFGRTLIILSGDLGQVPCIIQNVDGMKQYTEMFNNMESFNHFNLFFLKTIMRRNKDNDTFLDLLDEIRNYKENISISKEAIKIIHFRFTKVEDTSIILKKFCHLLDSME